MSMLWRCALGAAVIMLGAQSVLAQKMNGCPAGQAMQSSDPGGKSVTCVPIPDTSAFQQQITNEAAARQAGDNALAARIDALTEADIVGRWSSSGTTNCLQSSNGFSASTLSPAIPPTGSTFVSQLSATFIGTRTFNAGGTGRSTGTSSSMTSPATLYGAGFAGFGSSGGASVTTLDGNFAWSIQPDGTLLVDDGNTIVQQFTAPPVRVGSTVTIENRPSYVGSISKDRRTITLTHQGMSLETSITRDANGVEVNRSPRFCARHRVLIRLPD